MSDSPNQKATGAPRQYVGKRYAGTTAENYQRFFVPAIGAPLAADLIDIAALRPGELVLDVACGTGVVTRLAAERVGATGIVAGLDLNPGMLVVARSATPSDMAIEWHEGSAESMPLPDESLRLPGNREQGHAAVGGAEGRSHRSVIRCRMSHCGFPQSRGTQSAGKS